MTKKLLLADDSITIQKVVNLTFAGEDIVVESVTNGDQAVEKARDIRPSIVLADVIMPGQNGYEVCASIKADPDLAKIPVVLLVGTFEPFDEVEASRVKCDAYLTKPFDTSELIQLVHSLIEKASGNGGLSESKDDETAGTAKGKMPSHSRPSSLVSSRSVESFLGSNPILDLFDAVGALAQVVPDESAVPRDSGDNGEPAEEDSEPPLISPDSTTGEPNGQHPQLQVIPFPSNRSNTADSTPLSLSEDILNDIVERVVKRISSEVIREVAWEVVPELSKIIIRQYLEERDKSDDS